MFLFSKHENCTYLGFDLVKYETISTINTFLLLARKNNNTGNNFFKMVICIHENRFTECSTVKLSILYNWVSCPSAFLLLSLFQTFFIKGVKKCIIEPLSIFTCMGNNLNTSTFRYASPIYHTLLMVNIRKYS